MNTLAAAPEARKSAEGPDSAGSWTRYLVPLGRAAFSAAFLVFGPMNISQQGIAYGAQQGVPLPQILVPWRA